MATDAVVLERIGERLWHAPRPLRVGGLPIGTRMVVAKLPDGSTLLHSPVPPDEKTRRAVEAIGPVSAIVAPSKIHFFFVRGWAEACPEARVFAAPGLAAKRRELRVDEVLGDEPPEAWAGAIDTVFVAGIPRVNEVVLRHRPSGTVLLTDLAFHFDRPRDLGFGMRAFLRLNGALGRLTPSRLMRSLVRNRPALLASLDRILAWDFDRVTVTHGSIVTSGGRAALERAWACFRA